MTAATVEATAIEATETETEDATEVVNLEAFQAAVAAATTDVDALADKDNPDVLNVRRAYTDLGRKGKAAAKAWLSDSSTEALMEDRTADAKKYMRLRQFGVKVIATTSGGAPKSTKALADKILDNIKTLQIAYALAVATAQNSAATNPELTDWENRVGVDADDIESARTYAAWIEDPSTPEPEVADLHKQGARVSLGRGPKGQGRKPGSGNKAAGENAAEDNADADSLTVG